MSYAVKMFAMKVPVAKMSTAKMLMAKTEHQRGSQGFCSTWSRNRHSGYWSAVQTFSERGTKSRNDETTFWANLVCI